MKIFPLFILKGSRRQLTCGFVCVLGVLLLNAVLTVRAHQATSHKEKGWEQFTDVVVSWLNKNLHGVVFMLWGAYAQKKGSSIDRVWVVQWLTDVFSYGVDARGCFLYRVVLQSLLELCCCQT